MAEVKKRGTLVLMKTETGRGKWDRNKDKVVEKEMGLPFARADFLRHLEFLSISVPLYFGKEKRNRATNPILVGTNLLPLPSSPFDQQRTLL